MKKKSDILIKVLSLGIGLAVGIVLIAKVFFELSYDSFYKDIDRVYTIRTWYLQQGDEHDYGQVSGAVAVGFMEEVPGVEQGTRTTFVFDGDTYLDEDGNKLRGTLVCADTCFFKVLDRPILAGNPVKVLSKWGCVMVSRSFAEKLGGVQACIGKQIANADMDGLKLTIEGVFEDFPKNGSLDYDILLSMETYGKQSTDNWNGNDRYKGYVKLAPGVDPATLTDAIRKMQEAHQPLERIEAQGNTFRYFLKPFSKMHTSDPEIKSQVILLSIVAVLISLLGLLAMSTYFADENTKQIAVRKVFGSDVTHETWRNVRSYMVLTGIACAIGIPLAVWAARVYLERFAYRVENYGWVFMVAVIILLAIAFGTVLWQTLKAAKTNPAIELKKE